MRDLGDELSGLPGLVVQGLDDADARALLGSVLPGLLEENKRGSGSSRRRTGIRWRLLELPRALTVPELAGAFSSPVAVPLSGRLEESFERRLGALPASTRRLLLLAAAEPLGDPLLLWRAAERLGIEVEAADAAVSDGLLELGARVTFRHPVVRSAAYRAASPHDRREAHRALAEAIDPRVDPDARAWHRAQATAAPDERVASELDRLAGRAQARGGFAAAAGFLERSAALTPPRAAAGGARAGGGTRRVQSR